ncbi:MAG: hypothetical protein L3J43_04720 [Sulfurovum sp.]|nr:hypothetical protein [Sulfurovum sp.]
MTKTTLMDKYPIGSLTIKKTDTNYRNIDEIFSYLKKQIESHPVATYIGDFDHYTHTSNLSVGEIADDILDAKNIIFCFGKALPKPEMLAVRPRSIGIAEMAECFVVSFMDAPNPDAHRAIEGWVKGIAIR